MNNVSTRLRITNISITAISKGNIVATVKKLWMGSEIFRIMFHSESAGLLVPIPQSEEELVRVCRAIREASPVGKNNQMVQAEDAAVAS